MQLGLLEQPEAQGEGEVQVREAQGEQPEQQELQEQEVQRAAGEEQQESQAQMAVQQTEDAKEAKYYRKAVEQVYSASRETNPIHLHCYHRHLSLGYLPSRRRFRPGRCGMRLSRLEGLDFWMELGTKREVQGLLGVREEREGQGLEVKLVLGS